MKKLAILFSFVFFAFVIAASAQSSSASKDKQTPATEKVKSNDDTKAHSGCCAYSTKSCKAGSAKCCSHDKSEAKGTSSSSSSKAEATVSDRRALVEAQKK